MIENKNILLGIVLFFLSMIAVNGQEEIIDLDGHGKVQINYVIVSDKLPGIPIANLPNQTFDIAEHGLDTELRIIIKVLELEEGYSVRFCKPCYKSSYAQFKRINTPQKILKKGNEARIRYKYNTTTKGSSILALSFELKKGSENAGHYNSKGQKYTVINTKAKAVQPIPTSPSSPYADHGTLINLLERLEESSEREQTIICRNEMKQLSTSQKTTRAGRLIVEICTDIRVVEDWNILLNKMDNVKSFSEQKRLAKVFRRNHIKNKEYYEKVTTLLERIENEENVQQIDSIERSKTINENFILTEIGERRQEGQTIIITLEASNYGNLPLSLYAPENMTVEQLDDNHFEIRMQEGTQGTVVVNIDGFTFDKEAKNKLLVNTKQPSISVKFDYDRIEQQKLSILVEGGNAPYKAHIMNELGVVFDVVSLSTNPFDLDFTTRDKLPEGMYIIKVIDETGVYRVAAESKPIKIGGHTKGNIIVFLLLGLAVIGGIIYYLQYRKYKI